MHWYGGQIYEDISNSVRNSVNDEGILESFVSMMNDIIVEELIQTIISTISCQPITALIQVTKVKSHSSQTNTSSQRKLKNHPVC